jgi:hypothetical protein
MKFCQHLGKFATKLLHVLWVVYGNQTFPGQGGSSGITCSRMAVKSLEDSPCSIGPATLSKMQEVVLCDCHQLVERQLQKISITV